MPRQRSSLDRLMELAVKRALADVESLGKIEAKPDRALHFWERASHASNRVQLLLGSRAIHFVRGSRAIRNRGYQVQGPAACRASCRKSRQPAAIGRNLRASGNRRHRRPGRPYLRELPALDGGYARLGGRTHAGWLDQAISQRGMERLAQRANVGSIAQ